MQFNRCGRSGALNFALGLLATVAASTMAAGVAKAEALSTPAMSTPLAANPNPTKFEAGPLGDVYITGAVTGLAYAQNHRAPGDYKARGDLANAQVFIQTTEGPIQFFAQVGAYSIPILGLPYGKASDTPSATFGHVPVAYVKVAPSENFNIIAGKIPTLIGAEYTFTFQNTNITRGQLWNQENLFSRGLQANFSNGPLSVSVAVTDGFYSNKFSWITGLAAYAIDDNNTIAVAAGGNLSDTSRSTSVTPLLQNNSDMFNVIYTHTSGPLTLTPYFQYTRVPAMPQLGVPEKGSTTGFALLGNYAFNENFSLAARGEYIKSKNSSTNLLYGGGSRAWTFTVTPTYQVGIVFVRAEMAYIKASRIEPGAAFGPMGMDRSQVRGLIETGVLF